MAGSAPNISIMAVVGSAHSSDVSWRARSAREIQTWVRITRGPGAKVRRAVRRESRRGRR